MNQVTIINSQWLYRSLTKVIRETRTQLLVCDNGQVRRFWKNNGYQLGYYKIIRNGDEPDRIFEGGIMNQQQPLFTAFLLYDNAQETPPIVEHRARDIAHFLQCLAAELPDKLPQRINIYTSKSFKEKQKAFLRNPQGLG